MTEKEETKEEKKEKKEGKKEEKKSKSIQKERSIARKWKGKDWYAILAPKTFGEIHVAETPATDPKNLIGRTIEISAAELPSEHQPKPHMKVYFKIVSVDGNNAKTIFNGFEVAKEYLFRVVRKRTSKLDIVSEAETKDNWKLQISSITVLNRKAETEIETSIRKYVENFLKEFASKASIDDFVKAVLEDALQQHVKKFGSKIYPVRFNEISKIEVMKVPVS